MLFKWSAINLRINTFIWRNKSTCDTTLVVVVVVVVVDVVNLPLVLFAIIVIVGICNVSYKKKKKPYIRTNKRTRQNEYYVATSSNLKYVEKPIIQGLRYILNNQ